MSQYKGEIISTGKYTTGSNTYGDWSVQGITIQDATGNKTEIKVWNRPDLAAAKGKFVEIDGVTPGKGKNRAGSVIDILELKSDGGSINVIEGATSVPAQGTTSKPVNPTPKSPAPQQGRWTPPSQSEYEGVLTHAIKIVTQAFDAATKDTNVNHLAVAEVVKGYMVAYVKGDFEVDKSAKVTQPEKPAEVDPSDIPL
jgi:hypothetical protein